MDINTQIQLALNALRQDDGRKAADIGDQILKADMENVEGWVIKLSGLWSMHHTMLEAAKSFSDACIIIKDPAKKRLLIDKMRPLFVKKASFHNDFVKISKCLYAGDPKLSEAYIIEAAKACATSTEKHGNDKLRTLQEMMDRYHEGYGSLSIIAKSWGMSKSIYENELGYIREILNCELGKCNVAKDLMRAVDAIEKIAIGASKVFTGTQDSELRTECRQIKSLLEGQVKEQKQREEDAYRVGVAKYWEMRPEEKNQLEEELARIKQAIADILEALGQEECFLEKEMLTEKLKNANKALKELGLFQFAQKKEMKSYIAKLQVQLLDAESTYTNVKAKAQREIDKLEQQKEKVWKRLTRPY